MKREKLVSVVLTEDEKAGIMKKMAEKQIETGKRMTISSFIREFCIKPALNGNCSPPQETVIETEPEKPKNKWDDVDF